MRYAWNKGKIEWIKCKVCGIQIRKWKKVCSIECLSKLKKSRNTGPWKKGCTSWNKGIKMGKEFEKKCSERALKLGQIPPSRKGIDGEKHWNWQGGLTKIYPNCVDCGKQISHYRKRCLKCHLGTKRMTTLEIKTQRVIDKYNLPYKFVGNGKFFIEKKNPDFVNTNGQKIAVEVFWTRHKEEFRGGLERWKNEREEIFNKYGWKILFLDEKHMTENKILNSLGKGGN
jgi:predicted nucleic acid-binding Zn ribbon protein